MADMPAVWSGEAALTKGKDWTCIRLRPWDSTSGNPCRHVRPSARQEADVRGQRVAPFKFLP